MKPEPSSGPELVNTRIEFLPLEDDRRLAPRFPTRELSSLQTGPAGKTITCMVHNLSETGAMIETSIRDLPKRFILDNPNRKLRKLCRIVWSCGDLTGVEFIATSDFVQ